MKKFECTVTKEITMEIEIDETVWTPEMIKEWQHFFYESDDLSEIVEHLAKMKVECEDGSFIEGFGIPMIDGKKPWNRQDNEINKDINICNQDEYIDVTVLEIK